MGDLVLLQLRSGQLHNVEGGKMEHWFVGKIPLDEEINNRVFSSKN